MYKYFPLFFLVVACTGNSTKNTSESPAKKPDTLVVADSSAKKVNQVVYKANDTLQAIASLIGGSWMGGVYNEAGNLPAYKGYADNFSKRWQGYDTSRIRTLEAFRQNELATSFADSTTLFYPFSGPDILYPTIFFPDASKYILVGLEPVGTLPNFSAPGKDSLRNYFSGVNEALFAILRFSFFRTESMRKDLRSGELDGTLHLLLLFLNRTGNAIVSARPFTTDTLGSKQYYPTFEQLAEARLPLKGVEIKFLNKGGQLKELNYLSLDATDYLLKKNASFLNYMAQQGPVNVYLKGASYLLHKSNFSIMRNLILEKAGAVVQDDSGIALSYFLKGEAKWDYRLFGQYTKPIATFSGRFQPLLDSLYKANGSKALDFGLGYNYRDKNSNFMIATKVKG